MSYKRCLSAFLLFWNVISDNSQGLSQRRRDPLAAAAHARNCKRNPFPGSAADDTTRAHAGYTLSWDLSRSLEKYRPATIAGNRGHYLGTYKTKYRWHESRWSPPM